MPPQKRVTSLFIIDLLAFLFYLQVAIPLFTNSNFLASYLSDWMVGIIYLVSSAIAIGIFFVMPLILRRYGNYKTFLCLLFLQFLFLLTLAFSENPTLLISAFIVTASIVPILYFNFDIFLEHDSERITSGKIRGTFLTVKNFALVSGPLITSFILTDGDYWKVYLSASFILVPMFIISFSFLKNFDDKEYSVPPLKKLILFIKGNQPLKKIFLMTLLLQTFFSWTTIYLPLYLHQYLGFEWSVIGILFSCSLIPYIFLEFPIGKFIDKKSGANIMGLGFLILAIVNFLVSLLSVDKFFGWFILITIMGVGAALVEVTSETEFFKHISPEDAEIISLFRTMRPLSYIISPIIALVLFYFIEIRYTFVFLSLLMLYGLHISITPTKKILN